MHGAREGGEKEGRRRRRRKRELVFFSDVSRRIDDSSTY
jgi:uncharacterized protein with von Willebrand factor type A (vWA) domain